MRKFLWLVSLAAGISFQATAQDSTAKPTVTVPAPAPKKDWKKVNLSQRANDHFLMQFGYDGWTNTPDTINIQGFSRHFNFYLMYDMPFKTAPRMSVAGGVGLGTSNIFFNKTNIDIAGKVNPTRISFLDASNTNHFKKYKLSTNWIEVPVELRWVSDPEHTGKAWKIAAGVKIGTMIDAHTKGKNYVSGSNESTIYGAKYIEKEKSKKFMNNTRFAATMRAGWGPVTVYGAYQITRLFKENTGPDVHPYSIGLSIGGL